MPRKSRIYLPGSPYHIVQRGNKREACFYEPENHQFYLELWLEYVKRYWVIVQANCLVVNPFHKFILFRINRKNLGCDMKMIFLIITIITIFMTPSIAEMRTIGDTTITFLAVNGGSDTVNPGTTCFKLSSPVSATCAGSYIGIPNNNSQLISAALTAKSSGSKLWIYYEDSTTNLHCPGMQFTPCSLISIAIK